MSEYRLYHFLAVDRPLTREEMEVLRGYSSRARISPTEFKNHYSFGSFKGHEAVWMERYFDLHVYWANWGSRRIMMRVPVEVVPPEVGNQYRFGEDPVIVYRGKSAILDLWNHFEVDGSEEVEESAVIMAAAARERERLLEGDLSLVYTAWLLKLKRDDRRCELPEPPVPPGLGGSRESFKVLIQFLNPDPYVLKAALAGSAPSPAPIDMTRAIAGWVAGLPAKVKDEALIRMADGDLAMFRDWRARWLQELARSRGVDAGVHRRRGFELFQEAERIEAEEDARTMERQQRAWKRRSRFEAQQEEARIWSLAGTEEDLWQQLESVDWKRNKSAAWDATQILKDLKALDERWPGAGFRERLASFRQSLPAEHGMQDVLAKLGG